MSIIKTHPMITRPEPLNASTLLDQYEAEIRDRASLQEIMRIRNLLCQVTMSGEEKIRDQKLAEEYRAKFQRTQAPPPQLVEQRAKLNLVEMTAALLEKNDPDEDESIETYGKPSPNGAAKKPMSIIDHIKTYGDDDDFELSVKKPERTYALPGTIEKLNILAARIQNREELWHKDDPKDYEDTPEGCVEPRYNRNSDRNH